MRVCPMNPRLYCRMEDGEDLRGSSSTCRFIINRLVFALNRTPNSPVFLPQPIRKLPSVLTSPLGGGRRQVQGQELGGPSGSVWAERIFHFLAALCRGPEPSKPCGVLEPSSQPSVSQSFPGPFVFWARQLSQLPPEPLNPWQPTSPCVGASQDQRPMVPACARLCQPAPGPLDQCSWPGPGLAGSGLTGPALGLA